MTPTMRDIAKETGLSIATVSKCINGKSIKPENKELIEDAITRLNYIRNDSARAMKVQSTGIVAIVVPTMHSVLISEMIESCSKNLLEKGYFPIQCVVHRDGELEKTYLFKLVSLNIDGIESMPSCMEPETYKLLDDNNIPYVFFEQCVPDMEADTVMFNGESAAEELLDTLNEKGYKSIAVIMGNENAQAFWNHYKFLSEFAKEHGYELLSEYSKFSDTTVLGGSKAMSELLALDKPPEVVFCMSEELTVGAFMTIQQYGLKVPEDIAVVGVKSTEKLAIFENTDITCMKPSNEQMAKICTDRLIELMERKNKDKKENKVNVMLDVEFVKGNTI